MAADADGAKSLRNLHERNKQDMEALKKQMAGSTPEQLIAIKPQAIRLQKIHVHAEDNALPTLINDAYFKQFLLKEEHCLYRLANRLTNGATSSDLDEGNSNSVPKILILALILTISVCLRVSIFRKAA